MVGILGIEQTAEGAHAPSLPLHGFGCLLISNSLCCRGPHVLPEVPSFLGLLGGLHHQRTVQQYPQLLEPYRGLLYSQKSGRRRCSVLDGAEVMMSSGPCLLFICASVTALHGIVQSIALFSSRGNVYHLSPSGCIGAGFGASGVLNRRGGESGFRVELTAFPWGSRWSNQRLLWEMISYCKCVRQRCC